MAARVVDKLPDGDEGMYEMKFWPPIPNSRTCGGPFIALLSWTEFDVAGEMMRLVRQVVRLVTVALNVVVAAFLLWGPIRAGHLPPDGYGVIYSLFVLAPVLAVIAL